MSNPWTNSSLTPWNYKQNATYSEADWESIEFREPRGNFRADFWCHGGQAS